MKLPTLSPTAKYHLISGAHTVLSYMIIELAAQLYLHQDAFTQLNLDRALVIGMILAVVRAGLKAGLPVIIQALKDAAEWLKPKVQE